MDLLNSEAEMIAGKQEEKNTKNCWKEKKY